MNPHPATPSSPVQRVRHDIVRRDLRIERIDTPSPGFRAVTFTGPTLGGLVSMSFDDHLKFFFTDAQGQEQRRDYTPRRHDPVHGRLTLEFALHDGGLAAEWARQAREGDAATIAGPRGSQIVSTDLDWHWLAGDATALPAIARRLEELPAGSPVQALILVPEQDQRSLALQPGQQVQWVSDPEAFVRALHHLKRPDGEGFVWCAGEAGLMARAREVVLNHHAVPRTHTRLSAYWKQGTSSFHEDL